MIWTTTPPTEPGAYWVCRQPLRPYVVRVEGDHHLWVTVVDADQNQSSALSTWRGYEWSSTAIPEPAS